MNLFRIFPFIFIGAFTTSCGSAPLPLPQTGARIVWDGSPETLAKTRALPVSGTGGMITADDREAASWGAEILRQGGNAIDAAVATAFAMAVSRPHYASLGGGGFLLYCPAKSASKCQFIDYREVAPSSASRDMYIKDGKPNTDLSQDGALASGIPGVTSGLLLALEKFGTFSRARLLSRPIQMARDGIRVSSNTERAATNRWKEFNTEAIRIFGCGQTVAPCEVGKLLKQPDLARVLEKIAAHGRRGFYEGEVAEKIVKGVRASGGIFQLSDLASYSTKLREPIQAFFGGMEVITAPPPSSGGTVLFQILSYLERAQHQRVFEKGWGSVPSIHAITHAMSLAYADRAEYLGDPDFVKVPLEKLFAESYLDRQWASFNPTKANPPKRAGSVDEPEHLHTTHFSVMDREGNAVALTTTVNDYFGSGFVPPGTGIVMNNEMDDFSISPGAPNQFGLVGGAANSIAPGKRPLSSMTPTIVRDSQGNNRIVVGAQGGPKIITAVLHTLVNRLQYGMSISDSVASPRFHHQWKPGTLSMERFLFPVEVRSQLSQMGYQVEEISNLGVLHAIERFPNGRTWGAPDPRGEGAAVAE